MFFFCILGGNFVFFFKKMMCFFFLFCFCSCFGFFFGQDFMFKYEYFYGNNFCFSVSLDGWFFYDIEGGGDLWLSYKEEGRVYVSSLYFVGFWLGGLDFFGNLYIFVYLEDDENNGFQFGIVFFYFEGVLVDFVLEGINSVWWVICVEIFKYQCDYVDNGRIDDLQFVIYVWLGVCNFYYGVYNNIIVELFMEVFGLVFYWDYDVDGIYNLDEGDYLIVSNCFDCW